MVKFILQKINGLKFRLKCFSWGLFYGKASSVTVPDKLLIGARFRPVKFSDRLEPRFRYEFIDICVNDAYRLKTLPQNEIKSIVDIGANQGIFLLAARKRFPKSILQAYEPNINLSRFLSFNCKEVGAECYYEAVTAEDCKVVLEFADSDLETQVEKTDEGNVIGTSLKTVIARAGGRIDLLKIDCEGGEWELLGLRNEWKKVRYITMEYHLWHGKGHKFEELKTILGDLNFTILFNKPVTEKFGMLLAYNKSFAA